MPDKFTATLQTVSPSLVITQKPYDTSLGKAAQDLGGALGDFLKDYGEKKQEALDLETAGNFWGAFNAANLEAEEERDRNEKLRNEEITRLQSRLSESASKGDDAMAVAARIRFAAKMEDINLREQQLGISLDANRRSVVRQYMQLRPDMASVWSDALTFEKKLEELRSESANYASEELTQFQVLSQRALANGTTVAQEMLSERLITKAKESANNLQLMKDRGTINGPAIVAGVINGLSAELNAVMQDATSNARLAMAGQPELLSATRARVLEARTVLQGHIIMAEMKAKEDGMIVDLTEVKTYVNNYLEGIDSLLTEGNLQALTAAKEKMNDDALVALWHSYWPWIHPLILKKKGFDLWDESRRGMWRFFQKLEDEQGFANLVEAERKGDLGAREALAYARTEREWLKMAFEGSYLKEDAPSVKIMNELFTALSTNAPISGDLASRANPILREMLVGIKKTSLPEGVTPASVDARLIETAVAGYDSLWSRFTPEDELPILNPQSPEAQKMRALPASEWGRYVQPLADKLIKSVYATGEDKDAIVFSERSGFTMDDQRMRSIRGRALETQAMKAALKELNKYYKMVAATRGTGAEAATNWANSFVENYLRTPVASPQTAAQEAVSQQQPQTGDVTSNPNDIRQYDYDELADRLVE